MENAPLKMPEPQAAWATDCRDKYSENHDSGFAGRICLADGNLAWAAVVSDGCGGSMEGLKVSGLAVQAFTSALQKATLQQLTDADGRKDWVCAWTDSLHNEAFSRFRGGMATFCGAVILPPDGENGVWKLFSINVGDSQILCLTGDGKAMGINPSAPANHPNVEGRNPVRVVGVAPKSGFPLMDIEEFPLPHSGPCWILAGSDGFFAKKQGRDELRIFGNPDFRAICTSGEAPFHELPALALRRSLENAQKLDCVGMMDNATVAMLGFNLDQRLGAGVLPEPGKGILNAPVRPVVSGARPAPAPAVATSSRGGRFWVPALAAVIAFALGLILAGGSSGSAPSEAVPSVSENTFVESAETAPAASVSAPKEVLKTQTSGVPLPKVRCSKCWNLRKKDPGVNPFHWEYECPRAGE